MRMLAAALLASTLTAGCSEPAPAAIVYDSDACDHCRMTIAAPAFAAQLVTRTGKRYRFDDLACLAAFASSGRVAAQDIHSIWLNDHAHPEARVNVEDAVILVSERIKAPMNGHMAAFASRDDAAALRVAVGGTIGRWADIGKRAGL